MKIFRKLFSLMVVFALMSAFPPIRSHAAEELGYHLIEVTNNGDDLEALDVMGVCEIKGTDGWINVFLIIDEEYEIPGQVNPEQTDITWTKLPEFLTPGKTLELTAEVYTNAEKSGAEATFSSAYCNSLYGATYYENTYTDSYLKHITGPATREYLEIPVPTVYTYFTVTVNGGSYAHKCTVTYLYKLTAEPAVDSGARFSSISGQVEYLEPGSDVWEFATIETELVVGTQIKTAFGSTCKLSFKDMSVFEMKEETQVIILAQRPDDSKFKLVTGKIWANIKRMMKDGKLEIETTQCAMGIKGTIFSVEATADKTILEVFEGSVEFTCLASGEKAMVESGQTAYGDTKLSPVTEFDKNADKEHWDRVTGTAGAAGTSNTTDAAETETESESESEDSTSYLWLILAGAGITAVIVILVLILLMKKKKSRKLNPPQPQNFVTPQQPAAVSNPPSFCEKCGAKVDAGISFCANCGNRVN